MPLVSANLDNLRWLLPRRVRGVNATSRDPIDPRTCLARTSSGPSRIAFRRSMATLWFPRASLTTPSVKVATVRNWGSPIASAIWIACSHCESACTYSTRKNEYCPIRQASQASAARLKAPANRGSRSCTERIRHPKRGTSSVPAEPARVAKSRGSLQRSGLSRERRLCATSGFIAVRSNRGTADAAVFQSASRPSRPLTPAHPPWAGLTLSQPFNSTKA